MKDELRIPGVDSETAFLDAGRLIIEHRVLNMLRNEPGVRLGEDIEALHDMRVFSRRLRESLLIFNPCFKKKKIRAIFKRIRAITRTLGEVRNIDVFIEYIADFENAPQHEENIAAAMKGLTKTAESRRRKLRKALLAALDQLHTDTLYYNIVDLLATGTRREEHTALEAIRNPQTATHLEDAHPTETEQPALPGFVDPTARNTGATPTEQESTLSRSDSLLSHARRLIAPHLDAMHKSWNAVRALSDSEDIITALHALRITFKKLRYALEILYAAFDREPFDLLYNQIKDFQQILGDINDARVFHGPVYNGLKAAAKADRFSEAVGCALIAVTLQDRVRELTGDFFKLEADRPIDLLPADIEAAFISLSE
jgi:CHAD domain-containing protein